MRSSRKDMLLASASALAVAALLAATPAGAQTTSFSTGGAYTATEGDGGVLNAIATQVNTSALLSSGVATTPGATENYTRAIRTTPGTDSVDGVSVAAAGSAVSTNSSIILNIALGAAVGSTATIDANAITAQTVGSSATRTLDLDQVTASSPTALLGLRQSNDASTATARIGAPGVAGATVDTFAGTDGSGNAVSGSAAQAIFDALSQDAAYIFSPGLSPGNPAPNASVTGDVTRTRSVISSPAGTSLVIGGTSATNATATVADNAVEARVLFNSATQDAAGSAGSAATGAGAAAIISMLQGSAPVANSVAVLAPVSVASDQLNNAVNSGFTSADPTASIYNTDIGVALTGAGTPLVAATNTTAQVTGNTVSAALAGNVAANRGTLEGDSSAFFGTGFAVTTVQGNNATGVLGALVDNTNIVVQADSATTFGTTTAVLADASFAGTIQISGNAVGTSATGNSAVAGISNTLATALSGNFERDTSSATNVSLNLGATPSAVSSDLQVLTGQANDGTALLAQTLDTQVAILADLTGTGLVQQNVVGATAVLNEAQNSLTAVRGTAVNTASALVQYNLGSVPQAIVDDTNLLIQGTLASNGGTTLLLTENEISATATFNSGSQTVSAATSQSLASTNPVDFAEVYATSGVDAVVGAQVSVTSLQRTDGTGVSVPAGSALASVTDALIRSEVVSAANPAAITVGLSDNTVSASLRGNLVENSLALDSAALTTASGIAVVASQATTDFSAAGGQADLRSLVDQVDIISVAPSTPAGLVGTVTISGNTVSATTVSNSAVNAVDSTLATALQGSYTRSGGNTFLGISAGAPLDAVAFADVAMVVSQANDAVVAVADLFNVQPQSDGNVVGTVTVSDNLSRALSVLNQAEQSLALPRGLAMTAAVVARQYNLLSTADAEADDADFEINDVFLGSGSTVRLIDNQAVAGATLSSVSQTVTAASTAAAGAATSALLDLGSNDLTSGAQLLVGSVQLNAGSRATALVDDSDFDINMSTVGAGMPTVLLTGNQVVASALGNGATNAITLSGAASVTMSGITAATAQTNTISGNTPTTIEATVDSLDMRIDSANSGTVSLSDNTAVASAVGNSAATSVANSLGVALVGSYARTSDNVTVTLGASSINAFGDILAATTQRNQSTTITADQRSNPQIIATGSMIGTVDVDGNTILSQATANTATNGFTVIGGAGVNAAGVLSQVNTSGVYVQAVVSSPEIQLNSIDGSTGSTASVSGNTIAARTALNAGSQSALASVTESTAGSAAAASVLLDATSLGVGAQLQLATTQENSAVNQGSLPLSTDAAQVTNARVWLDLGSSAASSVATTLEASNNAVTAGVLGNDVTASMLFDGAAANSVAGAAVATRQSNASLGNMTARVDSAQVMIRLFDGLNGTASVDGNTVASSSVGNRSSNSLANAMGTLSGGYVAATQTTPSISVDSTGQMNAAGDYVVFNSQANDAVNLAATTRVTRIGIDVNAAVENFSTLSTSSNRVTAGVALNETTNALTLVQGNGIVGSLFSNQENVQTSGTTSAVATVDDTIISATNAQLPAGASVPSSTVLANSNVVAASSSGNVATNTVSNSGLSAGNVYSTAGTTLNSGGTPFATYGDYVVGNRQLNAGTAGTPLVINAQVLNTTIRMSGTLSDSTAQMSNNIVLASSMGNQASNRLALTGMSSASMGEASFQSNTYATISAAVQGASLTMAPATAGGSMIGSTMLMSGNTIGATATGNSLSSVIGR